MWELGSLLKTIILPYIVLFPIRLKINLEKLPAFNFILEYIAKE